ncbi:guanine nucleotide exchange factor MSS4 homolog [Agrilus planipennis]|uniref:Guanine nucleotide exchange factor MSS4 homolog n=1 Tax=Agrilus planipennis TaxID=224129 RepID=A0A1W4XIT4_AGRPL|nr:guanine nucleotide exchange factor MSS4 homolog [Agrilus planipennis]
MPDCGTSYENEVADGYNIRNVKCSFCNCTILKQKLGKFTTLEFDLPLMKQIGGAYNIETEKVSLFWLVKHMMTFENVGFSNTVDNKKYLTCADCDAGPIGFHDLTTKESFIALSRVTHR